MSRAFRICYTCHTKYSLSHFTRSDYHCNACMSSGVKLPRFMQMNVCKNCGTEIPTTRSLNKQFCNNECYHEFLNSDKNPRRGVSQSKSKNTHNDYEITQAEKPSSEAQRREQCKATLKTFEEISKICSKLHISYGQYQQYEALGTLDQMIRDGDV